MKVSHLAIVCACCSTRLERLVVLFFDSACLRFKCVTQKQALVRMLRVAHVALPLLASSVLLVFLLCPRTSLEPQASLTTRQLLLDSTTAFTAIGLGAGVIQGF